MTDNPWLSDAQLIDLTGYRRRAEQKRELDAMGIPYRMRTTGDLVVFRSACGEIDPKLRNNPSEPDYSAC
jgi:hypothetical protein